MAIWQALKELNKLIRKNIVLLIDSVAAIQAMANAASQHKKVILARFEIKSLKAKGVKVILQCVPSNFGLLGNEKADCLAKMCSHKRNSHPIKCHSTQLRHILRQRLDHESKTNGTQIRRRKIGRPLSKETVKWPRLGRPRSPNLD
jgi:hypothetical protein